jgi:hypothetical protein
VSLFDDRGAAVRVGVAALLLAALGGWYAYWALGAEQGWRWAMRDPVARDGAPMVFPLWEVTKVVGSDHYEISKVIRDIPLAGDARDLRVGDTVSVLGRFDASVPIVRVEVRELHPLRRYKEILGVLGLALVVCWVPFAFRVVRGRLVERG